MIETIITGTIAGLLVFVIQGYFVFRRKLTFLGYPRVRGEYTVQYDEEVSWKEVIEIRQLGSRISGKVKEINTGVEYSLTGNTTRSRYIIYQVYSKDINHNYFGAALLKLNKALRVRVWVISYLLEHGSEDFQTEILLIS